MLPVDLAAGGAVMMVLVLPLLFFYFGLCRKRWSRQINNRKGAPCPFLDVPAHNRCRACGTYVSDRAFHQTCSFTTQHNNGNGTATVITTTTSGWNHCAGCHTLKGHAVLIAFLVGMLGLWAYTVVERTLAVLGVTHRDERVRSFNVTLYALTIILGLVGWATVWCTRKTLLRFSCLTPCGALCCCGSSGASGAATRATPSAATSSRAADAAVPVAAVPVATVPVATVPVAAMPVPVTAAISVPPSAVVQGVPMCDNV